MDKKLEKKIEIKDIPNKIEDLKKGESILIELKEKESVKKFQFLTFKVESLENLYRMYMRENSEIANSENFKIFLNTYSDAYTQRKVTSNGIILGALGRNLYNYITKKNVAIRIDWEVNGIVIEKR